MKPNLRRRPVPPVLVVADRGTLKAYRYQKGDRPRPMTSVEIEEGNRRLSELVTDQAGAFPVTGSVGTAAAERLPLEAEVEAQGLRKSAQLITRLLDLEKAATWGLIAPPEIHEQLVGMLPDADRGKLTLQVKRNLVNSSSDDLQAACEDAVTPDWMK